MKHALFLVLLRAMQRKDKPLLVLDTHAGMGRYDVTAGPAARTGEWQAGIGRVLTARPAALADYCGVVERAGLYPGSPVLAASLLRGGDRLVCCELHPEDAHALRGVTRGWRNVSVHERDGYAAMRAFLPPVERRALVLVDPAFERADEFAALRESLAAAYGKFPRGVFAAWYPVKGRARSRDFLAGVKVTGMRDVVAAALWLRAPVDAARLDGCGLLVVNPPFGFEDAARPVLEALVAVLGEAGAGCAVERLVDE